MMKSGAETVAANQKFPSASGAKVTAALRRWFDGTAGATILRAELDLAATILPNLFGYHIVQLGNYASENFLQTTRVSHALLVDDGVESDDDGVGLVCRNDALALATNTIDVLVVPHVLEFSVEPHAVLREAERVLIGEGHIVIVGFNPWSLIGLWRRLAGWRGSPPWSGHALSPARVKDWLKLLGFEIEFSHKTSFRPPLRGERISNKLKFLELLGAACWPYFGNVYLIVAKKQVATITPLKMSWQTRRRMIAGGVAEPTTRANGHTPEHMDRRR